MPTEEEAVRYASECWEKGFNCAESVLRGVCYGMEIDLPDATLKIATPFGGGVGRCEDLCGALSGGVLAIGAAMGRSKADADKFASYRAAKELHEQFVKRFSSSLCIDLNHGDFRSPEHRVRCKQFTLEAVMMTYRTLKKDR